MDAAKSKVGEQIEKCKETVEDQAALAKGYVDAAKTKAGGAAEKASEKLDEAGKKAQN